MIKLANILNENEGDTLNLATPVNRKILSALLKYHPELIKEQKDYYRNSISKSYKRSIIYKTINNFLGDKIDIGGHVITNQIALLFLINPNINNSREDELFDGSNIYLTTLEYADDEILQSIGEEDVDCPSCDGWGYEDCVECDGTGYEECRYCEGVGNEICQVCDGSGEIEDEFSDEEGDTLVCDNCDGTGKEDCGYCNGHSRTDCYECDGESTIKNEYVEFEIEYHKKHFISYEPLDGIDEELSTNPIEEFLKVNEGKTMFLWNDDLWSETSKNNTNNITYKPNEFIDQRTDKINELDLRYVL